MNRDKASQVTDVWEDYFLVVNMLNALYCTSCRTSLVTRFMFLIFCVLGPRWLLLNQVTSNQSARYEFKYILKLWLMLYFTDLQFVIIPRVLHTFVSFSTKQFEWIYESFCNLSFLFSLSGKDKHLLAAASDSLSQVLKLLVKTWQKCKNNVKFKLVLFCEWCKLSINKDAK